MVSLGRAAASWFEPTDLGGSAAQIGFRTSGWTHSPSICASAAEIMTPRSGAMERGVFGSAYATHTNSTDGDTYDTRGGRNYGMTISTLAFAMRCKASSPLGKLILIKFANENDGSGQILANEYAAFCCTTVDDLSIALSDLHDSGILRSLGNGWWVLEGYREPVRKVVPGYIKRQLSAKLRTTVRERDGHACRSCGATTDLTVDHIEPERHGGAHTIENLQTLCRPCNSRKGARR